MTKVTQPKPTEADKSVLIAHHQEQLFNYVINFFKDEHMIDVVKHLTETCADAIAVDDAAGEPVYRRNEIVTIVEKNNKVVNFITRLDFMAQGISNLSKNY